jgi:hypothetical protein
MCGQEGMMSNLSSGDEHNDHNEDRLLHLKKMEWKKKKGGKERRIEKKKGGKERRIEKKKGVKKDGTKRKREESAAQGSALTHLGIP